MAKSSLLFSLSLSLIFLSLGSTVIAQEADPFLSALAQRHQVATLDGLEQIAGSREAMVERLLEIRHLETPPFAGIAAQKLLMQLAERADVQAALESDVSSPKYLGLARVVVAHIDSIPSAEARSRIARSALERASREPGFSSYARTLLQSSDSQVSRLAREALQQ